jgi:predicted O-methyltransferase YrrM
MVETSRSRIGAAARRWVGRNVLTPVEARLQRVVASEVQRVVASEVDRVLTELTAAEFRARRDLLAVAERDAALSSAKYADQVMPTARIFTDPNSTLRYALELAPQGGMALEFGVFAGRSMRIIAEMRKGREAYGFDSFQGLPEDYRPHVREGAFALDGIPDIEGAELVVGWFDDTLPGFLAEHPGPVDFLHVDGDLYSSAVTVFDAVGPRLQPGSIVIFDEFFNFPGWENHEFRAWQEYLERTGTTVVYEAYTVNNEQVVARIVSTGPASST